MTAPSSAAGIAEPETCLELRDICKSYPGVVANDAVNIKAYRGEILALLGENGAGKSTLMKIVGGVTTADEGSIYFNGNEVHIRRPRHAQNLGIGMVHQHFMLVPDMTVAENVAMLVPGPLFARSKVSKVRERIRALAAEHHLDVDPDAEIEQLSVGERQRVEILKLLYADTELLIFDEPTAVLTKGEWQHLAVVLRRLADNGKTIILITHKLDEVFDVADRCTVLRDGRLVGSVPMRETTPEKVVHMMVGRELRVKRDRPPPVLGKVALSMRNVGYLDQDGQQRLAEVSLEVRDGEILGVAGVEGNGQSYLVDVASGFRKPTSGSMEFHREPVEYPGLPVRQGLGVIPEDRHRDGVASSLSITENLLIKELDNAELFRSGIRRRQAIRNHADQLIKDFDIRVPNADVRLRQLSGGNQQKTVIARELSRRPRLLIAAQPTRGLDVGAMEYVYQALNRHRERGGATLLVSSEMEEILTLSDRIAVMVRGRIIAIIDGPGATAEQVGQLMISAPRENA